MIRETHSFRVGSLVITLPIGRTLVLSAAILALSMSAIEFAVRATPLRDSLVTPIVSGQVQIAAKLDLLADMEREGPVDCFFVGNSMVLRDINPEVVGKTYSNDSGRQLRCFNFGLAGLNIEGAARLSRILIAQHHPKMIVYGTNFRDYVKEESGFGMDIPWARYQLGQASVEGWLESTSKAYRYALAYTRQEELARSGHYDQGYSAYGYLATDTFTDVSQPPQSGASAYQNYTIPDRKRKGMGDLLGLQSTGTSIVVIEMPTPVSTLDLLDDPEREYQSFADMVTEETSAQSAPFWLTLKSGMIPDNGWNDYAHMNRTGATVFSTWLGHQLATLAQ